MQVVTYNGDRFAFYLIFTRLNDAIEGAKRLNKLNHKNYLVIGVAGGFIVVKDNILHKEEVFHEKTTFGSLEKGSLFTHKYSKGIIYIKATRDFTGESFAVVLEAPPKEKHKIQSCPGDVGFFNYDSEVTVIASEIRL